MGEKSDSRLVSLTYFKDGLCTNLSSKIRLGYEFDAHGFVVLDVISLHELRFRS